MRIPFCLAALWILTACQLPVPDAAGPVPRASLTVAPASPGGRTILPPAMPASSFKLSGVGPFGESFGPFVSNVSQFTADNLAYGNWTLTMDGYDGPNATGNHLLTGTATVAISSPTASAAVALSPLAFGSGTLSLSLSWMPSDTAPDAVTGTLAGIGATGGNFPLTFVLTGRTAAFTGLFASGTYLLTIQTSHSGTAAAAPMTQTVVLYKGQVSTWSGSLRPADFGSPGNLLFDGGSAGSLGPVLAPMSNDAVLTANRSGIPNAAYLFSGAQSFQTSYRFPTGTAPKSFSVWFKPTAVAARGWILDGGNQSGGASNTAFGLFFFGGVLHFHGQGASDADFNTVFHNNEEYHVAVTYDGTNLIGYVNGAQDFSVARSLNTLAGLTPTWIGARDSPDELVAPYAPTYGHFQGTIDQVRVFSRALTASEVATMAVPTVQWIQSLNPATINPGYNAFTSVATDGLGSTFAGGVFRKALTYQFGFAPAAPVTTLSTTPEWWNGYSAILTKYDAGGHAAAVQVTNNTHTDSSSLDALVYDPSTSAVYAAVNINGSAIYTFSGFGTVPGRFSAGPNLGIARFNGTTLSTVWAQSLTNTIYSTVYTAVAADASGAGYVYAGGRLGNGYGGVNTYNFGNSVTAATLTPTVNYWVVVQYNKTTGLAQWAKTPTAGTAGSGVLGLTCDPSGNVIAVGALSANSTLNFGGPSATGAVSGDNALIVKYSPGGTASWAKAPATAPGDSLFRAVAADASGNLYAVGQVFHNGITSFGGASVNTANTNSQAANLLVVKFDPSGNALWARSIVSGSGTSYLTAVTVDPSGRLLVTGEIDGVLLYDLGNGVLVQGPSTGSNALLASYDLSGNVLWAKTADSGSAPTSANGVAWDNSTRQISLAGRISGTVGAAFDDHSVAGLNAADANNGDPGNILLVKF